MTRRFALLALLLCAAALPARAETNATVLQSFAMDYQVSTPNSYSMVVLGVYQTNNAGAAGLTAGTSAKTLAQAYEFSCDYTIGQCTTTAFNPQQVADGSLSIDPLGNSGTFGACLVPSDNSQCRTFSLSLVRPTTTSYCVGCVTANPWVDPNAPAAHVDAYVAAYMTRYGYTVTGTFGGNPFDSRLGQVIDDQYTGGFSAIPSVTAP